MATKSLLRGLGEEVRERRRKLKLSQEVLSFQAGVHRNLIGRLERGTYNPSVLILLAIATKLGVTLSELFAAAERRM